MRQQDFNYLENFRIDYLDSSPVTHFTLREKTLVRVEGLEHNELNFQLLIKKDNNVVAQYQRNKLNTISSSVIGSLFTVLDQGKYEFVMTFMAKDYNIIK